MKIDIGEDIYWIGISDNNTALFENLWPLDNGVAYNSYIIKDEKNALIDSVELSHQDEFLVKLDEILQGEPVDYLIINHIEPDHSGAIHAVVEQYPDVKIVGNAATFKFLEGYYGIKENLLKVGNMDTLSLGRHTLRFFTTPMLHWPETMMTFCEHDGILFSGDAFGSFGSLNKGLCDDELENVGFYLDEFRRYYAVVMSKYGKNVLSALNKLKDCDIKTIASTHGPVWRAKAGEVMEYYRRFGNYEADNGVVVVYGTMYGNTRKQAECIAENLAANGLLNVALYDVSTTDISYILRDIMQYKAVVLGAPTYNGGLFPPMENLLCYLERFAIKDRLIGIFGGKTWTGGAVKRLCAFAENMQWKAVGQAKETLCAPGEEDFLRLEDLAKLMAKELLA